MAALTGIFSDRGITVSGIFRKPLEKGFSDTNPPHTTLKPLATTTLHGYLLLVKC